jgi:hypothetical protein
VPPKNKNDFPFHMDSYIWAGDKAQWFSVCLACMSPEFNPQYHKKTKIELRCSIIYNPTDIACRISSTLLK